MITLDSPFQGYKTVADLRNNTHLIPAQAGVYIVFYKREHPEFLETGTGGHFKGKNPNVSVDELKANWVTGTDIVYIGKAGGPTSSATLRKRLDQLFKFGNGQPVGHWGGRLLWQLKDSAQLVVAWLPTPQDIDPEAVEAELKNEFRLKYGARPFANLKG